MTCHGTLDAVAGIRMWGGQLRPRHTLRMGGHRRRTILLATAAVCLWAVALLPASSAERNIPATHPRIFVTKADLPALAARCVGPLAREYAELKQQADAAVKSGRIRYLDNKWATPSDLMSCGLAYLVEREGGRPCRPYADVILKAWGDGRIIGNQQGSAFGYHALAYDWIYDALDDSQRKRYGDALGSWLKWFSGQAAITLKAGSWMYNQTWGPNHLNVMHSRDAIVQKLFISLAIHGAGTAHEADARSFLDSWATRVPRECIPAFDEMGGSWAESHGHGSYGPIQVVPYAFAAWQSATGENLFLAGKPWSYLNEMSRWIAYLQVPHVGCHAYLDDGGGSRDSGFSAAAPFVARSVRDPLAQWFSDQSQAAGESRWQPWQRVVGYDPTLQAKSPGELKLPLGYLLKGAGHVFMRSAWDDPNATWAFFGAGPHRVGHQHDDEGHFLISNRGGLVSKGGGKGGNDDDHYWGGSLVFNIVTIFDPKETFRRNRKNENDGGLLRYVYDDSHRERGHIVAFKHAADFTYAAADVTKGYNKAKAAEVTRQFLYLRGTPGEDEYFVVFDRVQSTQPEFAKHFMLHVPEEPTVSGNATVRVPGHVTEHTGPELVSTWLSLPGDFGPDVPVLATGRSRMFLRTLLPKDAVVTKRGGDGHRNWGHPLEPTAHYDHDTPGRGKPPICRWRLEVAAPAAERVLFLHVFQVAKEGAAAMAPVKLKEEGAQVRLEIGPAANVWKVALSTSGPLAVGVAPPGKAESRVGLEVDVEEQYRQAPHGHGSAPGAPGATNATPAAAALQLVSAVTPPATGFRAHRTGFGIQGF